MAEQAITVDANDNDTAKHKGRIGQRIFRHSAKDTLPLTIHHERIYILPSHRGLAFICVIAIMLMASINYGLNLGYALCFILVGLFASCLLATYKNLVKISFTSISAADTFEGSPLNYTIRVCDEGNRDRSSVCVKSNNASDKFDLKNKGTKDAELHITNPVRGIHKLGRLTISSDFPLGLWRGWGYLHTPVYSHIYPQPESPVADFVGYNASAGGPLARRTGEQEFSGLKTYENSDSPSRVAWKRVASGAGWYSKQFEAEAEQREVAIRWQDTPVHLSVEQRLSRMCGWVVRARDENIAYTFDLPGFKPRALASGREHCEACLRALAAFAKNDESASAPDKAPD